MKSAVSLSLSCSSVTPTESRRFFHSGLMLLLYWGEGGRGRGGRGRKCVHEGEEGIVRKEKTMMKEGSVYQ